MTVLRRRLLGGAAASLAGTAMASVSGAVSRALLLPAVLPALLPTRAIAQQRFDVPYVPTRQLVVDEMLRLAAVDGNDFLIDLGSGDGRIVVTAARAFGIRGIGFDIDPQRIAEARVNARTAGVQKLVEFREENIFAADFSRATVVTMYLLTAVNLRLRPKLLAELKPGTRVVSHDFHMDDWEPDRRLVVGKTLYLWIIPARVEGKWRVDAGDRRFDLALRQRFQKLEGSATIGSRTARLWEGRLDGERIGFTLTYVPGGDASPIEHDDAERAHRFEGRVEGDTIAGLVTVGIGKSRRQMPFTAMRG
ncbi:MAG: SAM-dependent methyltransferase [bacterium]